MAVVWADVSVDPGIRSVDTSLSAVSSSFCLFCLTERGVQRSSVCFCVLKVLMVCLLVQVCVPVVSVRLVKKHKTAGLVPNGLVITTDSSQKVRRYILKLSN